MMRTLLLAVSFTVFSLPFNLHAQHSKAKKMELNSLTMTDKVIRISIGYFQPDQTEQVAAMLDNEFKKSLIPAIKKLKGNISFYVGIDREKHTTTNVSFWETTEDAKQMATLKEMLDMRVTFEKLGIKFIDITNHKVIWELPE